jgi:hypothetical protein
MNTPLSSAIRSLQEAARKSERLAERRMRMESPSKAARTSANASWMRASEDRDRLVSVVNGLGGDGWAVLRCLDQAAFERRRAAS